MKKRSILFFFFLTSLIAPSTLFSQVQIDANPNLITSTHFYSFKGDANTSKDAINNMQEELLRLEFVKDVLIKFSDEKKSGYIKVITQEMPVVKEGDHIFSPAVLKNMLFKYKLSPIVYNAERGVK